MSFIQIIIINIKQFNLRNKIMFNVFFILIIISTTITTNFINGKSSLFSLFLKIKMKILFLKLSKCSDQWRSQSCQIASGAI